MQLIVSTQMLFVSIPGTSTTGHKGDMLEQQVTSISRLRQVIAKGDQEMKIHTGRIVAQSGMAQTRKPIRP